MTELLITMLVVVILVSIFMPHFWQARNRANLSSCKQNLKNSAVALQAFSNENNGAYPATLVQLTPLYLAELPLCPAASADTYSPGYQTTLAPASYTVTCQGGFHTVVPGVSPNEPYYVAGLGLQP